MAIRGIKNVVGNYTNGEIKVRESTTNEPWGPTTAQLAEISDLCYQLLHFHEVMGMIEKRLNDKGKNYRHVAKGLLVLDYVIKTGPERVIQHWKDKLYIINTLKDFQFTDKDSKDQGRTIRDRAKQLTLLLNDNEMLLAEREKALETKKKFHSGTLAPTTSSDPMSRSWEPERKPFQDGKGSQKGSTPNLSADIKAALPSTKGEEDLQLQVALALSKEADAKIEKSSLDEENQYKQAIQLSKTTPNHTKTPGLIAPPPSTKPADPWASLPEPSQPKAPEELGDPWGGIGGTTQPPVPSVVEELLIQDPTEVPDPWERGELRGRLDSPAPDVSDPWGALTSAPSGSPALKPVNLTNEIVMGPDPWAGANKTTEAQDPLTLMDRPVSPPKQPAVLDPQRNSKLTAANTVEEDFLGSSNAKLVNLDALVDLGRAPTSGSSQVGNPFAMLPPEPTSKPVSNPFLSATETPRPTLNQMRDFSKPDPLQAPLVPSGLSAPSYSALQSSQGSDLASVFQTSSVPTTNPTYNFTNPQAPTSLSGFGQFQTNPGNPAFQTGPPVNLFGTGQAPTGTPAYSAFQGAPVPPGPAPGANYGGGSNFPQSSNPFF